MTAKKAATKKRKPQRGKPHKDATKAQVIALLLLGAGVMEIAGELHLPHSTVSTYKGQIPDDKLDEFRRKKGERLDEMVYDYMLANLRALTKQAEVAGSAHYIQRQRGGELATLHGVMADKGIRLLEATTKFRHPKPEQLGAGEEESE